MVHRYLNCISCSGNGGKLLQIDYASVDHARADFFDGCYRDFCVTQDEQF